MHSEVELQDVADQLGARGRSACLALLAVMVSLADDFGERVVLKGGSALRFAHGATRTSRDAHATVVKPAKSPIAPEDVMTSIKRARMGQFLC